MKAYRTLLFILTLVLSYFTQINIVRAQGWQQLTKLPVGIRSIMFLDLPGPPRIGFAGLQDGSIFKTTDGGNSWIRTAANLKAPVNCVLFKDTLFGWANGHGDGSGTWYTQDGGINWQQCLPVIGGGYYSALYYNRKKNKLFRSSWKTGGIEQIDNWGQPIQVIEKRAFNGFAFSDDDHGIISNVLGGNGEVYLVTSDGGDTWRAVPMRYETWQPAALKNTLRFYAFSETSLSFYRSIDGGNSWQLVSGPLGFLTSGCLQVDECAIYTQTRDNGLFSSTDEGVTWTTIGGPSNGIDTKFYLADGYLYAGGSDGSIWKWKRGLSTYNNVDSSHFTSLVIVDSFDNFLTINPDTIAIGIIPATSDHKFNSDSDWVVVTVPCEKLSSVKVLPADGYTIEDERRDASSCEIWFRIHSLIGSQESIKPVVTLYWEEKDKKESFAYLSSVTKAFDPQNSCFATAAPLLMDSVTFSPRDNNCADSLILDFMKGGLAWYNVTIRPNPASSSFLLSYTASINGEAAIKLYTVDGKLANDFGILSFEEGIGEKSFTVSSFLSGYYLLNIEGSGWRQSLPIIINK